LPEPAVESGAALDARLAPATSYSALRVRTLGGFAVWRGATSIGVSAWRQGKVGALFKCLLGAPNNRLHREVLVDWLWPDAELEAGADTLRQTLFRLRRALSNGAACAGYVRLDGEMLTLVPAPDGEAPADWLDAAAFESAAAAAQDLPAAARWLGAAATARTDLGKVLVPLRATEIARLSDQVRAGLAPEAFEHAWMAGAALSIDRALDEAMRWTPPGAAAPSPQGGG